MLRRFLGMTLLGLGIISLMMGLLVFANSIVTECSNISENINSINVLDSVVEYTSSNLPQKIYALYEAEINELANYGSTAYSIYLYDVDLNNDGRDEIVSFFVSVLNSGSSGNFKLDIWEGEDTYRNIGPMYTFCLNPKGEATGSELIFHLDNKIEGYPILEYCTLDDANITVSQVLFGMDLDRKSFNLLPRQGDGSFG